MHADDGHVHLSGHAWCVTSSALVPMSSGCCFPNFLMRLMRIHAPEAGDPEAARARFPHFFDPSLPKPLYVEVGRISLLDR